MGQEIKTLGGIGKERGKGKTEEEKGITGQHSMGSKAMGIIGKGQTEQSLAAATAEITGMHSVSHSSTQSMLSMVPLSFSPSESAATSEAAGGCNSMSKRMHGLLLGHKGEQQPVKGKDSLI